MHNERQKMVSSMTWAWTAILLVLILDVSSNEIVIGIFHPINVANGESAKATSLVATRSINENPHILPGYNITAVIMPFSNSGKIGYFLASMFYRKAFFNMESINQNPNKIMAMVGPVNTAHIEALNQVLVQSNILELNHDAGGESLTSTKRFPYLFNIAPPISVIERATITLLKHMKWMKIAVVLQNTGTLRSIGAIPIVQSFEDAASKNDIKIELSREIFFINAFGRNKLFEAFEEIKSILQEIKKKDVRIIVLFVDADVLRFILCEAYKLGLFGSRYIFLNFFGELSNGWISDHTEGAHFKCSKDQLLTISKNLLILSRHAKAAEDQVTVANETVGQTYRLIEDEMKRLEGLKDSFPDKVLFIYDAIWAFALSLHNIVKKNDSFVKRFSNNVKDPSFLDALSKEYTKVNFQGASGWLNFTTNGDKRYRDGQIALLKYEETDNVTDPFSDIAIISKNVVQLNTSALHYGIPRDRPLLKKHTLELPKALIVTMWVFSGIGIIMALSFLVINIIWRNVKFLKLSSPNINSLICIGCVLSYTAVICYGLDTQTIEKDKIATICNVTSLLLSMGFTLIFGSLFSKTWRIYRIFTKSQAARYVVIKDFHLLSIVLILLTIDLIIFILRIFLSPFQLEEQIVHEIRNTEKDTIERDVINRCKCEYQTQMFLAVFIYKGVLMMFGLFVAYETRHIKVAAISDSSYIGAAVYNCSLFVTLGAIVVYSLYDTERFKESYIVFALCILQATTITLCLVFVPKIFMLVTKYDDPNFKNGRPVINDTNSEYLRSDVHSSTVGDTLSRRWPHKSETSSQCDLKLSKLSGTQRNSCDVDTHGL